MIQPILIGIALLASALGFFNPSGITPYTYDDGGSGLSFGATNFPTSLDALTNPGATDSVATVSHSAQHANANDAIEALQAKMGISASTPIANSIFAGNGTGSSIWTTFATTTSLSSTNLLVNGSSTLQNFTFSNATGTNATTTNLYVSGRASTTDLRVDTAVIGNETVGNSTITNLTVTSCVGCSSGGGITMYVATSTTNRYFAKTLNLVSGDMVTWWASGVGNNCGTMDYRMSSPWSMASTTIFTDGSCADDPRSIGPFSFLATTTSVVTFTYQAGNAGNSAMTLLLQGGAYAQQF